MEHDAKTICQVRRCGMSISRTAPGGWSPFNVGRVRRCDPMTSSLVSQMLMRRRSNTGRRNVCHSLSPNGRDQSVEWNSNKSNETDRTALPRSHEMCRASERLPGLEWHLAIDIIAIFRACGLFVHAVHREIDLLLF